MSLRVSVILKFSISAVLLGILCSKFSVFNTGFKDGLRDSRCVVIAIALPFTIIPIVTVNRWKLFLKLCGIDEKFLNLWKINLISCFQGLVLPSTQGFDAFRMYHIAKRHPEGVGGAAGSVLIERMIGMLVWCGIALVGLPLVLRHVETKWSIAMAVIGFSVAAAIGSLLVVSPRFHRLYAGRRPKMKVLAKVIGFLDKTHETLVTFPYRKVLLSSIGLIIVYQFCSITCVWLLFNAYGVSLPLYMHMAFYPVIAIIAMMPVTIGGFGVREGAFAYFYSLVGGPAEVSVCVSVANYVVLSLLPAALGGVIWLWELIWYGKEGGS